MKPRLIFKGIFWSFTLLLAMLPFQNCGQPFRSIPSPINSTYIMASNPENLRFEKASRVLESKCTSCHREGGSASFARLNLRSENEFIASGMVTPGDPSRSKLIYRLKNYTDATVPNRNMPVSGTLTTEEYNDLLSWVNMIGSSTGVYKCDTSKPIHQTSIAKHLKRHSRRQYLNTLQDLFSRALSPTAVQQTVMTVTNSLSLPQDDHTTFSRTDTAVISQHMRSYFDASDRIAQAVTSDPHFSPFVSGFINLQRGSCTTINISSLSSVCVDRFIENFVSRALRRPLSTASGTNELEQYRSTYNNSGGGRSGINAVVFTVLLAPSFLYQIENNGLDLGNGVYRLSSFEIISRLSYMFWNTMPDEHLFGQALANDLTENSEFLSIVNYVSESPKAQDSIREFVNEWLKLNEIPQFSTSNPSLQFLAEGLVLDSSLRTAMIQEVEELGSFIYNTNSTFNDLFTSNVSFARDPRLMSIYGVSTPAQSTVTLENATRFPASERAGLLTRGALLLGGSELANPIKRGLKVRKDILCLNIEAPPADLEDALEPPQVDINRTTRQRYDHATSPQACMNCHQYINPLGHAFSSYNSFGKFWEQEPTFNETGNFSGRYLPVTSDVDLSVGLAPGLRSSTPVEFSRIVASQRASHQCVSEKFLRFSEGRAPDSEKEGCRLNNLYNHLSRAQSLKDFVKALTTDPEFRYRYMGN